MTDPESILQLGIEAARDGNKDEARNLFRLLTREDPRNVQAWIWLAGVAENREERQASLEQVLKLEPDNQLALKGLQALGTQPTMPSHTPASARSAPVEPPPSPAPPPLSSPSPSAASRYDDFDDDDPFAGLTAAFEEAPEAIRRDSPEPSAEKSPSPPPKESPTPSRSAPPSSAKKPPESKRDPLGEFPPSRSSSRSSDKPSDKKGKSAMGKPPSIPPIPRVAVIAIVVIILLGFVLVFFRDRLPLIGGGSNKPVSQSRPTPIPEPTAPILGTVSPETPVPGAVPPETPVPDAVPPETPVPVVVDQPTTTPLPNSEATPVPAPAAPGDEALASANPATIAAGANLQNEGWTYTFPGYPPGPVSNIGSYQGRFMIVLVFVVNSSGQQQTMSPDFFVLKDSQGRIYHPKPEISTAYRSSGGSADLSQQDPIPADGLTRSIPIVFDVAPDATNLVFFSRTKPDQGWQIHL